MLSLSCVSLLKSMVSTSPTTWCSRTLAVRILTAAKCKKPASQSEQIDSKLLETANVGDYGRPARSPSAHVEAHREGPRESPSPQVSVVGAALPHSDFGRGNHIT